MYSEIRPMVIYINCAMRTCNPLEMSPLATGRDIYIQVSIATNLSRKNFKLFYKSALIQDNLLSLSSSGVTSGSQVSLHPNIRSGSNFVELDPVREAIRKYVFSLSSAFINDFFEAREELAVRIPVGGQWGNLKFKLDKPLPSEPFDLSNVEQMEDMSNVQLGQLDQHTYLGHYSGSIPRESYDSRGVPSRTVDTVVSILDDFVSSCGLTTDNQHSNSR